VLFHRSIVRQRMKKNKAKPPEWPRRILALRTSMDLTQAAFASRLHYSAMALSRWERGTHEPTAQSYIQLGNLAGDPQCWWFWGRAGFSSTDLSRMFHEGHARLRNDQLPELEIIAGPNTKTQALPSKSRLVVVPMLAAHAATHGHRGDDVLDLDKAPVSELIAAPESWCPNPGHIICLTVRGDSMAPLIHEGDIVAVDSAQTDPKKLSGKIALAWQQERGLMLSRFLLVNGTQLLESENLEYKPVAGKKNRNWRIVGRVLWWIRKLA
jgi:phage repressor protein C with HTH and peptisase S24 domain